MSIQDQVRAEMKDALRGRDQRRLDVLRQVETEIAKAKTAPGFSGELDDALYQQVIGAYVKRMSKALKEYEQLGSRAEAMADTLRFEVEYLAKWLPQKLDEQATRMLVRQAIAESGLTGPQAVGRVVGQVMKAHKDQVDGGLVKRLAAEELTS